MAITKDKIKWELVEREDYPVFEMELGWFTIEIHFYDGNEVPDECGMGRGEYKIFSCGNELKGIMNIEFKYSLVAPKLDFFTKFTIEHFGLKYD